MRILFYLIYLIVIVIPGVLLILGAFRFKTKIKSKSGNMLLWGAVLILLHLVSSTGTYLVSVFYEAPELAAFVKINSLIEMGLKYIGLVIIAIGLLTYKVPEREVSENN
ncbi:hypothetical protein QQ008_15015 [Fulvivirgaceae bacterium BMA10]|uniref:Uncharacterized protein n=1 Tax=Splendidivirga corallicola TaxID=3051826 RepID=A0ABT8KSS8_9BACT|nr:hypothetical protein [Fulvivirgaceae bacterium BMA10]